MLGAADLAPLPKVDLHCHLDGSLRVGTILELADGDGVELPAVDEPGLRRALRAGEVRESLNDYLAAFAITTSVLQTEEGLRRAAFELGEDVARENVRYIEVRFSPVLHTRRGLALEAIIEAVLAGLAGAQERHDLVARVIVCSIRNLEPAVSLRLAELAARYRQRGVVGFDLAGPEGGNPARRHRDAFTHALVNNLSCTVHAGEAEGAASVGEAVHLCGAHRIGHATRLGEDESLLDYVNDHRIPLEVCLTSNVQTRAVEGFAEHPLARFHAYGLRATLNTDNRLMSDTTVTKELLLAHEYLGFDLEDLKVLLLNGFKSAFLPLAEKKALVQRMARELGLAYPSEL